MTAREIADRYWRMAATSHRLDKAQACAKRCSVEWDAVVTLIAALNGGQDVPSGDGRTSAFTQGRAQSVSGIA